MTVITRQLPFSIDGRGIALDKAKNKNDNLPVGTVILNPATQARLDAITFPLPATVTAKVNDYKTKLTAQSNLKDATDAAEEAVETLTPEADKVIKKVWDEVETYYNEETPESMRNNAVEWGEVFITLGEETAITFRAVDSLSGAAIQDVEFEFLATGKVHKADDVDSITAETRLVGDTPVEASHPDYTSAQQTITIAEGVAMAVTFTLVRV